MEEKKIQFQTKAYVCERSHKHKLRRAAQIILILIGIVIFLETIIDGFNEDSIKSVLIPVALLLYVLSSIKDNHFYKDINADLKWDEDSIIYTEYIEVANGKKGIKKVITTLNFKDISSIQCSKSLDAIRINSKAIDEVIYLNNKSRFYEYLNEEKNIIIYIADEEKSILINLLNEHTNINIEYME